MKTNLSKIGTKTVVALFAVSGLALSAGCAHPSPPKLSGFLTQYLQLDQVDKTTWRYIESQRLGAFNKFRIAEVQVLASYLEGKPLSEGTKQKVAVYLHDAIANALSEPYSVVITPGKDVADIRVAVTEAYMTENRLGLTVEGEIIDPYSYFPIATVIRTDLSLPHVGSKWDGANARQIMDEWGLRLRKAIDKAHAAHGR
jgi:hypothetical protein